LEQENWIRNQQEDENIKIIKHKIESNLTSNYFLNEDNIIYHISKNGTKQKIVPRKLIPSILNLYHDDPINGGHLGINKTLKKISLIYYWDKMKKDITEWINSCIACQHGKEYPNTKLPLQQIKAFKPWEIVQVDFTGPLPTTRHGNKYLLIFTDYVTKWVEAFPTPDEESKTFANIFIKEIICRYGPPSVLQSDNGKSFVNKLVDHVNEIFKITRRTSSPYHPQSQGLVERFNGTIKQMMRSYLKDPDEDWDEHIPMILNSYRTTPHTTTKFTPFYLMFGREQYTTSDIALDNIKPTLSKLTEKKVEQLHQIETIQNLHTSLKQAKTHMDQSFNKNKKIYKTNDPHFKVNDWVLVYDEKISLFKKHGKKISPKWIGPFRIKEIRDEVNAKLISQHGYELRGLIHLNRCKKYVSRSEEPEPPSMNFNTKHLPPALKRELKISQLIGARISVYWPTEKRNFIGIVKSYNRKKGKFNVKYEWDRRIFGEKLLGKNAQQWRYCEEVEVEDYSDAIDENVRLYGQNHTRDYSTDSSNEELTDSSDSYE
jgi:transposase InsO family protein